MNELQSKTIAWLRFALVMMVLLVHVHPDANPNFLGMGHLAEGNPAQAAYTIGVSALFVVCNVSVPLFFFSSPASCFSRRPAHGLGARGVAS